MNGCLSLETFFLAKDSRDQSVAQGHLGKDERSQKNV